MKNLYEGILGNVDDIMNAADNEVRIPELVQQVTMKIKRETNKLGLNMFGFNNIAAYTSDYIKHSSFRDGVLRLYVPKMIMTPPIMDIIDNIVGSSNVNKLEFPGLFYVDDYDSIDASTFGTNDITALRFQISNCKRISNLRLSVWNRPVGMGAGGETKDEWIDPSGNKNTGLLRVGDTMYDTSFGSSEIGLVISSPYPRLILNNVSVNFSRTFNKNKIWFACPCVPDLSGFFCNCEAMMISAEDLFDSRKVSSKICSVIDVEDLRILSKTAKAFSKYNDARYNNPNPVKDGLGFGTNTGNLSDIINLSGCSKCNMVAFADDELCVYFVKGSAVGTNDYQIEGTINTDIGKTLIFSSPGMPKTKDGWYIGVVYTKGKRR
jgi:hypothetical protein